MAEKNEEKLLFKAVLPEKLSVQVNKAEEGGYWAKAIEIPCYAQGESFSELFDVLTKAVYAYYNVPEELISELGHYLPVESVQNIIAEETPPEKYTLEDILPKQNLDQIRQLQRVS